MIYTYVAVALVAAAGAFTTAWKVQTWRFDSERLAVQVNQRATERLRRQNADTAATGHEADKTLIRTEFVTITERVDNEIQTERVVYDRTCIAPGGLQQLADAARAAGYTPQPGNPMPAASAAE